MDALKVLSNNSPVSTDVAHVREGLADLTTVRTLEESLFRLRTRSLFDRDGWEAVRAALVDGEDWGLEEEVAAAVGWARVDIPRVRNELRGYRRNLLVIII